MDTPKNNIVDSIRFVGGNYGLCNKIKTVTIIRGIQEAQVFVLLVDSFAYFIFMNTSITIITKNRRESVEIRR